MKASDLKNQIYVTTGAEEIGILELISIHNLPRSETRRPDFIQEQMPNIVTQFLMSIFQFVQDYDANFPQ